MQIEQEMTPSGAASSSSAGVANAPGVVATVVVTQPAPLLPEVLGSLAAQDYPNLQVVVLVTGSDESSLRDTSDVVAATVPAAHVRQIGGNPGFGPAANAVLRLVEGDSGFFLLMHDDVALDPGAVTAMVEEVYRSNAGIVGPKLVDWDDPRILQVVGYDADRLGVLDGDIEPGEIDQEQHDAVRDVFVVPSACLLVRADLFRTLGGFEPSIDFHGDDVDLCWRAHASGARVVVVPAARARHVGRLRERRPDLAHDRKSESHRATTVAVMTGGLRLPWTLAIMLAETIVESFILAVRGRFSQAAVRISTLLSLLANVSRIVARRRRVRGHRHVPDHEVFELQVKGSVRWRRWVRSRKGAVSSLVAEPDGTARRRSSGASVAYLVLAVLFVVGTRDVIAGRVARIGSFLPVPSPRSLLSDVLSGWWSQGLGVSTPHPTAHVLLSLAGFVTLGHPALVLTILAVGSIPVGWWGMSRLCAHLVDRAEGRSSVNGNGADRIRVIGTFAYAAVPLPYAAAATGRLSVVVGYAAMPWVLHLARVFGDAPPRSDDQRLRSPRVRALSALTLLMGVVLALAPAAALLILVAALVMFVFTGVAPGATRSSVAGLGATFVAFAGAVVLNLPWVTRYLASDGWTAIVGVGGTSGRGLVSLMTFDLAHVVTGGLVLALYVPTLVAPLVARDVRLVWAFRAAGLVVVGVLLAVIGDGGHAPFTLPDSGVLLLPVACGLALGAAVMVASFVSDVRGGRFGWRQPLSIIAVAVTALGLLPAVAVSANGSYRMPSVTFVDQMHELLGDRTGGDFRVLVVGDPALVPGAAHRYSGGDAAGVIAFSVLNNGVPDITDVSLAPSDDIARLLVPVLDALSRGTTERVGRLAAPLGVRYVVVPLKGDVPSGLVDALETQLDLRRVYSPASMMVFENTQFIPVTAMLSTVASGSSTSGGMDSIARADMSGSIGVLAGVGSADTVSQSLPEGTLHLGVPLDERWRVSLDGVRVASRASFGSVMAFELDHAGQVKLSYRAPMWRHAVLLAQLLLWAAVVVGIVQPRRRRRGSGVVAASDTLAGAEPVFTLAEHADENASHSDGQAN